jgi:diguanylate cyclase (GGDEF)-like protein
MRKADGDRIWVDVSGSIISYNSDMSLWLVNDISEMKRLESRLRNQVECDNLTGLYSRGWFIHLFEAELNRAKRYDSAVSILMIDIDLFKSINDTYGHATGDLVLQKFANICLTTMRESDICGRLGGEEFSILLPETNLEAAYIFADHLRGVIEKTDIKLPEGPVINITVSIGASSLSASQDSISTLIKRADTALYEAKNSGRNKVIKKISEQ